MGLRLGWGCRPPRGEKQPAIRQSNDDRIRRSEGPAQDLLGQGILHVLLNGSLQRPCTVDRIVADVAQELDRLGLHLQPHVAGREPISDDPHLEVGDLANLISLQRVKDDDVVDVLEVLAQRLDVVLTEVRLDDLAALMRHCQVWVTRI